MQSYMAGTWSTWRYVAGTQSTRSYANGTWSTRIYLAGTWSTDSINVNKGLWLVRKWSGKATNGTKGTAGYGSTKTRPNGVVCGLSTAMYGVA